MNQKPIVIIPARMESTRFPGKPLALVNDKPMIVRVWEQACQIPGVDKVVVATDDELIADVVCGAGGEAVVSDMEYETGTDRVADVARVLAGDRLVLNVQGDLPFFHPQVGSALLRALQKDTTADMATPVKMRRGFCPELMDPNVVKVIFDLNFRALYFGRSPLPSYCDADQHWYKHLGVYAYRNSALQRFAEMSQTTLERAERLEQLRALEHGMHIRIVPVVNDCGQEVNTPEDLVRANRGY
jgi:3-deoxy-manno-octulosonate cytidylyltransferase (CMP-KDO synthetase)